jgi:hypothetical protein
MPVELSAGHVSDLPVNKRHRLIDEARIFCLKKTGQHSAKRSITTNGERRRRRRRQQQQQQQQ